MPEGSGWKVLVDREQKGSAFETQQEAVEVGRTTAKGLSAEFQLHGEDGQIREKDSYGSDPRDIKG